MHEETSKTFNLLRRFAEVIPTVNSKAALLLCETTAAAIHLQARLASPRALPSLPTPYARVSLMGHSTIVGAVEPLARGGLRVRIEDAEGEERLVDAHALHSVEWMGEQEYSEWLGRRVVARTASHHEVQRRDDEGEDVRLDFAGWPPSWPDAKETVSRHPIAASVPVDGPLWPEILEWSDMRVAEHEEAVGAALDDRCTGMTAIWCPRCGDCKCPLNEAGERSLDGSACPLHAPDSAHAITGYMIALGEEPPRIGKALGGTFESLGIWSKAWRSSRDMVEAEVQEADRRMRDIDRSLKRLRFRGVIRHCCPDWEVCEPPTKGGAPNAQRLPPAEVGVEGEPVLNARTTSAPREEVRRG